MSPKSELKFEISSFESSHRPSEIHTKHFKKSDEPLKHHFYFFHGERNYHRQGLGLLTYFNKNLTENFKFSSMDFEGHGLSSGSRTHFVDQSDVIKDIEKLFLKYPPEADATLICQGMGAIFALSWLLHNPDLEAVLKIKRIVVANPSFFHRQGGQGPVQEYFQGLFPKLRFSLDEDFDYRQMTRDKELIHDLNSDPLLKAQPTNSFYRVLAAATDEVISQIYFLDIPILFLLSDENYFANIEQEKVLIRGIDRDFWTQKIYPGGRCDLFNDIIREEVFEDIHKWLQT